MSARDDTDRGEAAGGKSEQIAHSSGLVAGRFRIGELLGTGGSASVFAAVDTGTGLPAALKILHPHLSERPAAREAFLAEARRAEPLRHPNIVGVLGVGVDDAAGGPLAWIALERAAGSSLSEHIARHGALSPPEAIVVVDGVLRALEAAHAIGLIHRDVSPSNVMVAPGSSNVSAARGILDTDGVRLLDFGLADAAGKAALGTDELLSHEATGRAGVMGNANYLSPEQARGDAVDARGDVYQAGALLYFALTGGPPFPRKTAGQTLRAHLETPPPVPSVVDSRVPRALDRIVVRAMLKDPADRFSSATAMRDALTETGTPSPPAVRTVAVAASKTMTGEDSAAAASADPVPAERADDANDVTRVLGRTVVPPREQAGSPFSPVAPTARTRSRAGTWFAVTVAIIISVVVSIVASNAPTVSVAEQPPVARPSATSIPTEQAPQSEPEPVEPVTSLRTVPDLTRYRLGEALQALADAGLTGGQVTRVDSPLAADTVLETRPAQGRALTAGEPVALIVASGFHAIPDVAGQGRDAAAAMVQAAGFAPSFAYRAAPAGTPTATILGTDPAAGTVYAVGTSITILEAMPAAPTPTPRPSHPTPTPTPTLDPDG